MTTAHVVETSVTVNNNSPIQDYVHPDDHAQPTYANVCFAGYHIIYIYRATKGQRGYNFESIPSFQ